MTDLPNEGILDPTTIQIERNVAGTLTVIIGETRHEEVNARRAFPLEVADEFIGLTSADGEEIGIIEKMADLDESAREALEAELGRIYFLPRITQFSDLGEEFGVIHAGVETTSGPRQIEIRGIRSSIRVLSRRRALIEDTDGNRYELRDFDQLPKLTREILGL